MHPAERPTDPLQTEEEKARKRVKEIRDFYIHLGMYLVFLVFFFLLDFFSGSGVWWHWPALGWGIGVASHAISTFGMGGIGSSEWEERKVREMLARQNAVSRSEVHQVVHEELEHLRSLPANVDVPTLLRRIENLETIVTSRDWDLLESPPETRPKTIALDEPTPEAPADEVARLAKRVR